MSSLNSQVLYNYGEGAKPIMIGEGDNKKAVVGHSDFTESMSQINASIGEKILQDNQDRIRQADLVSSAGLTTLDPGTATTSDLATQLNSVVNVLNSLIQLGKDRG